MGVSLNRLSVIRNLFGLRFTDYEYNGLRPCCVMPVVLFNQLPFTDNRLLITDYRIKEATHGLRTNSQPQLADYVE